MSLTTARRALTRAVCPGTRASFSSSRVASAAATPAAKPKDGARQVAEMTPEQIEELSVFQAVGGLTSAAIGGIVVFVIGAGATLGVASGISQVLGASRNRAVFTRRRTRPAPHPRPRCHLINAIRSRVSDADPRPTPFAGHTMNSKAPEPPPPPTKDELRARLAEWRKRPRGPERDDAVRAIKDQLRELRRTEGSWW